MRQIAALYNHILSTGVRKEDRTGVGTIGVFGYQMRFDLEEGFPLVTKKYCPFNLIASELIWFLKGKQDEPGAIMDLHKSNNHIWDEWVKDDGSFGPIYGVQWRRWGERLGAGGLDQIAWIQKELVNNPYSRRLIVSAWDPSDIPQMALPPCHVLYQLCCRPRGDKIVVDMQMYQRSCDSFLGVPFNVASYALLLEMHCAVAGERFTPGELVWTGGDVHIYTNHVSQVEDYLSRPAFVLPTLGLAPGIKNVWDYRLSDMKLVGYQHSGRIAAEVAV